MTHLDVGACSADGRAQVFARDRAPLHLRTPPERMLRHAQDAAQRFQWSTVACQMSEALLQDKEATEAGSESAEVLI